MKMLLKRLIREEAGQDIVEYTLLLAFVALASAGLFVGAGTSIGTIWNTGSTVLGNAATAASGGGGGAGS